MVFRANGMKRFDPRWLLEVKGQGQTLQTLKSNISKTVRDREMVSVEVEYKVIYGLSNGIKLFDPRWPSGAEVQGQALKAVSNNSEKSNNSETVRDREMVCIEVN